VCVDSHSLLVSFIRIRVLLFWFVVSLESAFIREMKQSRSLILPLAPSLAPSYLFPPARSFLLFAASSSRRSMKVPLNYKNQHHHHSFAHSYFPSFAFTTPPSLSPSIPPSLPPIQPARQAIHQGLYHTLKPSLIPATFSSRSPSKLTLPPSLRSPKEMGR
jgi:hypothetical protein